MATYLYRQGVATVPIVMIFGVLTVAIGVGISALVFSESISSQSTYQSARALIYAEAGARDALERIARNRDYSCPTADCYTLDLAPSGCLSASACARVTVSAGAGTSLDPKIVTSEGQTGLNVRTLRVDVIFDSALDGEIATTTWSEVIP